MTKWLRKASGRPADMIARIHTVCKKIKAYIPTALMAGYVSESLSWTPSRLNERSLNHVVK